MTEDVVAVFIPIVAIIMSLSLPIVYAIVDYRRRRDVVEANHRERMAAIERGEGADEAVVRGWLAKALTASRGPQWCCDRCQAVHSKWDPICDNCGGFDTLSWREPPERTGPSSTGAEVLPLIVNPLKKADDSGSVADAPTSDAAGKESDVIDLEAIVRRGG